MYDTLADGPNLLHLGTTQPDRLAKRINAHAPGVTIYRDGDDWEEWGEPIKSAEHVTVRGLSNADALRLVADVAPLLVAMMHDHQAGIIASITDAEDWAEEVAHVRFNR